MSSGRHIWKRNIDLLKAFGDKAINGKRVIGIVTGVGMDSVKEVLDQFGDFRIDQLLLNLNQTNGETQTIVPALPMIASEESDECFFYAHTKGVSWAGTKGEFGTSEWTECMYRCLFEYVDQVDRELMRFPVVGAIKMHIMDNPYDSIVHSVHYPPYGWMYSGSFFACRHNTFFCNKHWNDISETNNDKFFIERLPAIFFRNDEAGTIFKERNFDLNRITDGGDRLYVKEYWEKTDWRKELSDSLFK